MIRFAIPLIALAATAGCMDEGRPGRPGRPMPGVECNANGLGRFVGQPRSPRVGMRAQRMAGARSVRWIEPGMAVTMDFRADRLNLTVNQRGRITGTRCG
jgi:hypothetical protein